MNIQDKLTKIAEDMPKVYEAGKTEGIAEGKQAEYDAFWDGMQKNGNRTEYANAFNNVGWTDITFKPKYDFVCVGNIYAMFAYSQFTELTKTLDISKATNTGSLFYYCIYLKTVHRIVIAETTDLQTTTFAHCLALENITFEGTICQNNFNVQWSPKLSKSSITSIINALSTTTSGLTVTLSKTAVNNAFATADGVADGSTSAEWLALVGTRSNWTIALA
jgi:hypothetical protein